MSRTVGWASRHFGRYATLAYNYVTERGVFLGALLIPAVAGASPSQLGRLELLLTAATLAATMGPLGTQHALMYQDFRGSSAGWRASVATAIAGGFLVGGAGSITLGPRIAVVGGVLGTCLAIHRVATYRMRAENHTGPLTWSSSIFIGSFALGAALVYGASDPAALILPVLMLATLAGAIPAFGSARRIVESAPFRYASMLRYGLPLSLAGLFEWIVSAGDRYVIQLFLGLDAVGSYGLVYRTAMLLSGAVSTIVLWWQAEAMRRGFHWARLRLRNYLAVTVSATIGLSAVVFYPLSLILQRLTGLEYADIAVVVAALFVSILGFVVLMGFVHLYASAGRVRIVGLLSAGNGIANMAGNFALIPTMGIRGAAVATGLSQCLTAGAAFVAYRRSGLDSA